ncbi:type VII secretion protein EssC [Oceanobacillus sp. CFH 90083]|uniref:type VII secretion protein EssC n=1 Tax=Oceanobacillus sp. CFH 90083 TaxID=2592336 RepID=UPI00128BC130|nr:type VII secretion protein EssC [Oceanobacillus sp. CFH 90083]
MASFILFAAYQDELHKCHLTKGVEQDIVIGSSWRNAITLSGLQHDILLHWDGDQLIYGKDSITSSIMIQTDDQELRLDLFDLHQASTLDTQGIDVITLGSADYNHLQISGWENDIFLIRKQGTNHFYLEAQKGKVYHNYRLLQEEAVIEAGDHLFMDGALLIVYPDSLQITTNQVFSAQLTELVEETEQYDEEYPDYHRSPRLIYREPEEKQTIAKPAAKPNKPSEQLARTIVPPLVMIAALIIVTLIRPRGIFIFVMFSVTVVTVIFAITTYFKNVKKYKEDMHHRETTYKEYMKRKTKELFLKSEEQRHSLYYHYPDVEEISTMAVNVSERIYEKHSYQHDFLSFRAGIGDVEASYAIDLSVEEFMKEEDELVDEAKALKKQFEHLENVPITTSLMKGPVGYIGHRQLVLEQLQLLVLQLSMFHSYHDLQFITVFPEEEKSQWYWMRWLPHSSIRNLNVRGFVYHERSRDQVMHSFYQILKQRKQAIADRGNSSDKLHFSPHYVVMITDEKLLLDHTIMELFNEDPTDIGVSLIFVQEVMRALPEHVKTVIDIRDAKDGKIIIEEEELVNKVFTPDHFPNGFDKEHVARALASINHLENLKNSIPEQVTFLELYNVEQVESLSIGTRWQQNQTYKSLAVPLGLRGKDDIVQLNLHEKAHGPHGLVAGTTGSGKSEIIQSYILSLAVNFHPYEVAFLLIDYKGGGMANLFEKLPHLLGTITNLDRSQALRALASIKAELQRRQRLFGEHQVNHINQYQKLFKEGKVEEAMPHLFLISDEFAELKSEQPDFMKELVSTARIGRSLGIHLILATQKPSGVVDDQIWSNSKFKLALKVQNASDSNEILKTADAAEITLPGRAYMQVGNNEIYELFQSAWSGADYIQDKKDPDYVDTTIYAINELGQYDLLNEDLSGLNQQQEMKQTVSELDAVIDYIHDYTEQQQIEQLPRPWLPPLAEQIYGPELRTEEYKAAWLEEKKPLEALIGIVDQPELQQQTPLTINLSKEGHILAVSSPGYGKSTFLQTVVMDLSSQHSPEHLHVYLLDFGTNGLLPLKHMPHVADTFSVDDEEKIGKLLRLLSKLMKDRKKKLSKYGVANLAMYEKASGEIEPNICIVLDNYEAVRDMNSADEFERMITQVAREGAGIGIHLIMSTGRQGALRMPLLSNIKTQISLYQIDRSEVRGVVGRTELEIEEIPGRGIISLEDPALFQTVLPTYGEEVLEQIDNIQKTAEEMLTFWSGSLPEPIPMMPEGVIDFATFKEHKKTKQLLEEKKLPLGFNFEDVQPFGFDPMQDEHLLVVSDRKERLNQMIQSTAKNIILLKDTYRTMFIDTVDQHFQDIGKSMYNYVSGKEEMTQALQNILYEIDMREKEGGKEPRWLIQIADLEEFMERTNAMLKDIYKIVDQGSRTGIHFIFCSHHNYIGSSYDKSVRYIRDQVAVGLVGMRVSDQDLFKKTIIRKEKTLENYECFILHDFEQTKVKVPE